MSNSDSYFMRLAIEEAIKGGSKVFPNPRVGAIIVSNDKIISSGYHEFFGGPHAETSVIKNIKSQFSEATLYVTLEPCNHRGKTSPCSDLIKPENFSRVVIGTSDPNPAAKGGIDTLRSKGIKVDVNILQDECRKINRRFFTFHEKKRPYVILKIASTMDGFIAQKNGHSKWITNEKSRNAVHQLRSSCDAILVGNNTVTKDNPKLTSHGVGKNPKILLFKGFKNEKSKINVLENDPIIIPKRDLSADPKDNIKTILDLMYEKSLQTLLVEGGGITFSTFFDSNFYDEVQVYYAPKIIGEGLSFYNNKSSLEKDLGLTLHKIENFENDIKITYIKE